MLDDGRRVALLDSGLRDSGLRDSGVRDTARAVAVRYGLPFVFTGLALLLTRVLGLSVFPTPLFFAAIVASTWYGTVASGLLTVVLAMLALDTYFIPAPRSMAALPHLLQFALPASLTCWFVKKRKDAEVSLRTARDELEVKVRERTAELRAEIAERVKAEEVVHKTQTQLAHVTRVMTMGELATSIAHELNQPLMAIVVNGDATARWLDAPAPNLDEARAAVGRMISESTRASEIIARIRAMSQNASAQRERVDLHAVISEILALTSGELAANGVAVTTRLADGLPPVSGDRVQLQQVLLNLVMNAIEAMSVADLADESVRELRIHTAMHGRGEAIVSVRDSGVGLPARHGERIFDAFVTTKPQGIGMGLSISRTIIERHAGRLWAEPAHPGAIFHFTLPIHP